MTVWYWPEGDILILCEPHMGGFNMISNLGWAWYLEEEDPWSNLIYIGKFE